MENYKKQTGHCFRMKILEATNTVGKHDYQQCRFDNFCQNSHILQCEVKFILDKEPISELKTNFDKGADCLLSRVWLAEWEKGG